jgi:predicted dithiol-disulfide oxidoreductase (DUF899 family)
MARYKPENESQAYRDLRQELVDAEIALKDQCEAVAGLRRRLRADTPVPDYVLLEGPRDLGAGDEPLRSVQLSGLFEEPQQPLMLMHFMYGKKQTKPCPMCTMWADGYDGVVPHLAQKMSFAVLIAGDVGAFRAFARERGWRNLRVLSAGESTIKTDLGFEDADGAQEPGVSVFTLGPNGQTYHFYSGGAMFGDGQFRGMDLLSPVWHFLDLTPQGRGDWLPSLTYD